GCLLVHGFTGSPWEMRWLGEQLAGDGHTVLGVRLAGHGTCPEDMSGTRWPHWYAGVLENYRRLRAECEQVRVMGLSMGGAPALLVYSPLDPVAPPAEMRFIHERLGAAVKEMVTLERSGHVVCNDVERERVLAAIRRCVGVHTLYNETVRPA